MARIEPYNNNLVLQIDILLCITSNLYKTNLCPQTGLLFVIVYALFVALTWRVSHYLCHDIHSAKNSNDEPFNKKLTPTIYHNYIMYTFRILLTIFNSACSRMFS